MKTQTIKLLVAVSVLMVIGIKASVLAQENSQQIFDSVPIAQKLDSNQKERFLRNISTLKNYHNCFDTIANCLTDTPADTTAIHAANFIVYLISKDFADREIENLLKSRAETLHPAETHKFDLTESPVYGKKSAEITLVEFADFKCPYCQKMAPALKQLVDASNGRVKEVYKYFPIKGHTGGLTQALGAAAAQNQEKFWEMYSLLFKNPARDSESDMLDYAQKFGLKLDKFRQDMNSEKSKKRIEADKKEGIKAGVKGTPTIFINGKRYTMPMEIEFLAGIINEEAAVNGVEMPFPKFFAGE